MEDLEDFRSSDNWESQNASHTLIDKTCYIVDNDNEIRTVVLVLSLLEASSLDATTSSPQSVPFNQLSSQVEFISEPQVNPKTHTKLLPN